MWSFEPDLGPTAVEDVNPQERELEVDLRVKRYITLPAHVQDYDLSGPGNRRSSSATAARGSRDVQRLSQDQHSPSSSGQVVQPCDEPEELQQQNKDLMQTHDSLLAAMEDLKLRNYNLDLKIRQSEYRLEQLKRHSTMETKQLRAEIQHLGEVVQRFQPTSSQSASKQEEDGMNVTHRETATTLTPRRHTHCPSKEFMDCLDFPHGQHSPHPSQSTSAKDYSPSSQQHHGPSPTSYNSLERCYAHSYAYSHMPERWQGHSPARHDSPERHRARFYEHRRTPERHCVCSPVSCYSPERSDAHPYGYSDIPERRYDTSPEYRYQPGRHDTPSTITPDTGLRARSVVRSGHIGDQHPQSRTSAIRTQGSSQGLE